MVCIVLLRNDIYIFLSFLFFPFCESISVCGCLTMHPNGFDLVTACLIVGEGTGN